MQRKLCCAVFFAFINVISGKFINIIHISVSNCREHYIAVVWDTRL